MELDGRTVAITGVGGFIGRRMAELAEARGMAVRGLDVSAEAARSAEAPGRTIIVGSTTDPEPVSRLCEGADVVLHTAAVMRESGDIAAFREVNVAGSALVARTAAEAGVARLVHLSSVMVYGFDFPPDVDESGPIRGEGNPYCTTKYESEAAVLDYDGVGSLGVTVIRPGDVVGADSRPWVLRPIELMKAGLFVLPDGGRGVIDPTYVDNLIHGVFLALENDATGEVFNITDGRPMPMREFFGHHAAWLGKRGILTLPAWLLDPAFTVVAAVFGALGKEPPATPEAIRFLLKPHGYSNQKARDRLGYAPQVGFEEAMRRTHDALVERGTLDR